MKVSVPKYLNPIASGCLEVLKDSNVGKYISLGGAFGLSIYHEFRATKDVDAR